MKKILLLIIITTTSVLNSKAQSAMIHGEVTDPWNIDSTEIWLIKYDSTTKILSAVDSVLSLRTSQASQRPYSFYGIAPGVYRIKAAIHKGTMQFGQKLPGPAPTYYGTSLFWNTAQTITVGANDTLKIDFALIMDSIQVGRGFIGGSVLQGANKGTANGIGGMTVFLLDANDNFKAYAITDANGDYKFDSVPDGSYKVYPEQLNYISSGASITIDATNQSHAAVNFERSNQNKTINLKPTTITNVNGQDVFTVYPNPASSAVNISWANANSEQANIRIINITGKQVLNTTVTMTGVTTVDVSTMPTGLYLMNINDGISNYTQKLTVE